MHNLPVYQLDTNKLFRIGDGESCDIRTAFPCNMSLLGDMLYVFTGDAYINRKLIKNDSVKIDIGDSIHIETLVLTRKENGIVCGGTGFVVNLPEMPPPIGIMDMHDFPSYKRPPRIVKNIESIELELKPPKAPEKPKKGQILKTILPPLIMAVLMVGTRVMSGGNLIMILMSLGLAVSVVFSVTSFFSDKKDAKESAAKRIDEYEIYLLGKRKEIYRVQQDEIAARTWSYPSLAEINSLTNEYSSRIYERTPNDGDFLSVSLGTSDVPPQYKIRFSQDEFMGEVDALTEEARAVVSHFSTLKDMPLVADLKKAHLGLVGEKELVHDELKALIAQICFLQSYHDVELVIIAEQDDRDVFEWTTKYPHMKISAINVSGLITSENHRDMALGALTQILKSRKMKLEDGKKDTLFLPHYIFIVDDPKKIVSHSIMEYLKEEDVTLGFSLIWTSLMRESLPENIGTILSLDGRGRGKLLMSENVLVLTPVKLPAVESIDFERIARRLTAIKHNQGVTTHIPESITFFDLFGIKNPEDLDLISRWSQGNSAKSLAVPLGLRGPDDVVYLNLHEKAHGPHGLVAGTTGSGKSEILQSYILSLAVHFHPYEVGFLLIDYKGGGMANLFKDLPHLLGTITNLDGSESMRALASIKSELARRQRIFTEVGVNNITNYTKAFRNREAKIPLPHLFIISDEFAELKKEQPDFMSELVSAARIGRSLGVHLILATQKPSGVVNDQIWSNSKFKLALKVQDAADSNEVLKTPDAAMITIPGRAYLQVGNNEIYELFQSAWSGAEYSEAEAEKGFDTRVYLINELGQGELLNADLSDTGEVQETKLTQLDSVVQYISSVYSRMNISSVDKPWLPSLPQRIASPHVGIATQQNDTVNMSVAIGIVDIPEQQAQYEFIHDFSDDGNFAVFGASGFGKSTVLTNMVLTLASKNSPDKLHFYIMDLGNSALVQLKDLPHTADYMSYDHDEKIDKFTRLLSAEMGKRKRLFAKESATGFKMYNQVAEEKLPAIVVLVDGFDVVKEISDELLSFFLRLTRDGTGVGMYTAISASATTVIRYAIVANFKDKIALYMYENAEITSAVGRSKYTLTDVQGRAMVNSDGVNIMQSYLPVNAEDDIAYAESIRMLIYKFNEIYPDSKVKGIPILPEVVSLGEIERPSTLPSYLIPIGLDSEDVALQMLDLREGRYLVLGKPKSGKTNTLRIVLSGIPKGEIFIVDSAARDLSEFEKLNNVCYLADAVDAVSFIERVSLAVERRRAMFEANGAGVRPIEFYSGLDPMVMLIDDGDRFARMFSDAKSVAEVLKTFFNHGGAAFITAPMKGFEFNDICSVFKEATKGIILGAPNETNPFNYFRSSMKSEMSIGYIMGSGEPIKIKMPLSG